VALDLIRKVDSLRRLWCRRGRGCGLALWDAFGVGGGEPGAEFVGNATVFVVHDGVFVAGQMGIGKVEIWSAGTKPACPP